MPTIKARIARLEAFRQDDDEHMPIPFRVYSTDADGRRTYRDPDADDLAAAERYAPKGIYHHATD